jgi:hypothetical protein
LEKVYAIVAEAVEMVWFFGTQMPRIFTDFYP